MKRLLSKPHVLAPVAILLFACPVQPADSESTFTWSGDPAKQLHLKETGKDVLTFQIEPTSLDGKGQYARSHYVHPLHDPAGEVITEDFPADHPHHRGIFWTWHQLLLNGQSVADPWMCIDIEWSIPELPGPHTTTDADNSKATLRLIRDWTVPDPHPDRKGQRLGLVRETTRLTVWPSAPGLRRVDFDLTFRALVKGVALGGSDDSKGYGGFSPRIRLAEDVKFVAREGEVKPENNAVEGGAWMDIVGTLDNERKGVLVMVHPSHPGFPVKWILRARRSMQNAQWPGRQPVALSTTEDVRLRYRLALHLGDLNGERLEELWQDYVTSQPTATP